MQERRQQLTWLVLLLVFLVAFFLRFYHLGDKGLWGDEIAQARWSLLPLDKLWTRFREPPDYLLHFFFGRLAQAVGTQAFFVRLPSAIASLLAVALQYVASRRLVGDATALFASLLLAVSPFQIWYAQDARMYSAHALYSVLAIYFFVRLIQKPNWWTVIGLSIANALAAYNHFFGFMLPLIEVVCAGGLVLSTLLVPNQKPRFRLPVWTVPFIASLFIYLIGVVPLLPGTAAYLGNPTTGSSIEASFHVEPFQLSVEFLQGLVMDLGLGPDGGWRTFGSLALAVVGMGVLARRRARSAWILIVWLVLPLALVAIAHPSRVVANRYFIFLQPSYLMLIAVGIVSLARVAGGFLRRVTAARDLRLAYGVMGILGAVVFLYVAVPPLLALYPRAKLNDWQTIANYLNQNARPGDMLIGEKNFWAIGALEYYLPDLNAYSIPPGEIAAMSEALREDRRIWYISFGGFLNPNEEAWVRTNFDRVSGEVWHRPTLCYADCGEFRFPQSEELVTLYRHVADTPFAISYSNELGSRAEPRPFLPVRMPQPLVAQLQIAATPRALLVEYSADAGTQFRVEVNEQVLGRVKVSTEKGWQTQEWAIPGGTAEQVLVRIVNETDDTVVRVRSVSLKPK